MLMLSLRLLCLLTCVALAACSIPYKTPDAQARIEHDLNIAHGDIVSMAETNFCAFNYGQEAFCRAEIGLGVLTHKGLILATYSFGQYKTWLTLRPDDVLCGRTDTARDAPESFVMFTRNYAAMIIPLDDKGQFNGPMHGQISDYLLSKGQPLLIGNAGAFTRPSERNKVIAGMIPGTNLPYATEVGYREAYNPCQQ